MNRQDTPENNTLHFTNPDPYNSTTNKSTTLFFDAASMNSDTGVVASMHPDTDALLNQS